MANQSLVITLPANSANDPIRGIFGAALVSNCQLQGDFDMQVGFQLLTWPLYSGVRTGLGSLFELFGLGPAYSNHYAVERDGFAASNDFPNNQSYLTDLSDGVQGLIPANDLSGMLRVTRAGYIATGYYFKDGTWTLIHSGPMSAGSVGLEIASWGHDINFLHQPVKVSFNNFTLSTGHLICPRLTANPSNGPVGTRVAVVGTDFPIPQFTDSQIRVTFDDLFLGTTANNGGSFTFTLDVPVAQSGLHEIRATDLSTGLNASTPFQVTVAPGPLSVALITGAVYFPGDTVVASISVTSSGVLFSSSSLQVQLNLTKPDNSNVPLSVTPLGNGLFRASYSLPKSAAIGTYSLFAVARAPSFGSGTALSGFEVKLPWLSSQATTAVVAGIASVGIAGVGLVSWRMGLFKRASKTFD